MLDGTVSPNAISSQPLLQSKGRSFSEDISRPSVTDEKNYIPSIGSVIKNIFTLTTVYIILRGVSENVFE